MGVPGGDALQIERDKQAQIKAQQDARAQEHQQQQQMLHDFFAAKDADTYKNKDLRKEDQIRDEIGEITNRQKERQEHVVVQKFDRNSASYLSIKDHTGLLKNQAQLLTRDKKWYNLFKGDSQEMIYVKQSLNYLNNLLDSDENILTLREKIAEAYRNVLAACEGYVYSHPSPWFSTGVQRLAQVKQIQQMVKQEQTYFAIAINNLQAGKLQGADTTRELIASLRQKDAVISRYQAQGNSSDVYRVTLKDKDGRPYDLYLKKDEKLLNEDLPGYLDRRIEQLGHSLANKKAICKANGITSEEDYLKYVSGLEAQIAEHERNLDNGTESEEQAAQAITQIRSTQEEMRLTGRLNDADYDFAIRFLQNMKDTLSTLGPELKKAKTERYLKFLGHDFDSFFNRLKEYNSLVQRLGSDRNALEAQIAVYREKASVPGKEGDTARAMVKSLRAGLQGKLETKNEFEWIRDNAAELGLDVTMDAEILELLAEPVTISRLFLRSLGKEAELFGQQCERSGLADTTEALASNNTATARLAAFCNMQDVVTGSWKEMMTFQEFGKKEKTTALCTVSEVAEGEEMLSLVEQAEKVQKEKGLNQSILHYSPNAVRQLLRLQMFDTLCLQTDRHWRNFKCQVTRDNSQDPPVWTIESLKSYDHDQSFGPKKLKEYFEDKTDPVTGAKYTNRPGFLPPLIATVDKTSKLYSYLKLTKMGGSNDIFLTQIKKPQAQGQLAGVMEKYKQAHDGKDFFESDSGKVNLWMLIVASYKGMNNQLSALIKQANPGKEQLADNLVQRLTSLFLRAISFSLTEHPVISRKDKENETSRCGTDMIRELRDLLGIYQQLDLTNIEGLQKEQFPIDVSYLKTILEDGKKVNGTLDYLFQVAFYLVKTVVYGNQKLLAAFEREEIEDARAKIREELQKQPNDAKLSLDEQVEKEMKKQKLGESSVQVPTLLHMDREAYDSIANVVNNWEAVRNTLLDLGWPTEKQLALKERAQEIIRQAKEAQQIVQQWAKQQGLPDGDIRAKFFLDAEDYEKIESITDVVADPSMSYFSIEDPSFLVGETAYQELLSKNEKEEAVKNTNAMRATERQHLNLLEGSYHQMVSAVISKVKKPENVAGK